jgi:hypothetical protein
VAVSPLSEADKRVEGADMPLPFNAG